MHVRTYLGGRIVPPGVARTLLSLPRLPEALCSQRSHRPH
jgi:hypothetical protein